MLRRSIRIASVNFCTVKRIALLAWFTIVTAPTWCQSVVDKSAEFPGGLDSLYRLVQQNLKYPDEARRNRIEAQVYVQFIVNEKGEIDKTSVRSIVKRDELLEMEGVRALRACTVPWKPAYLNGVPVSQQFVLPINFKLTDIPQKALTAKASTNGIALALSMSNQTASLSSPIIDPSQLKPGKSFFGLTTSAKEVQLEECFVVQAAFYVPDDNRKRMQFGNLGTLMQDIVPHLGKDSCWNVHQDIRQISGEAISIKNRGYTKYAIHSVAVCPRTPGVIEFPALKLMMFTGNSRDTSFVETPYFSKPVKVKVNRSLVADLVGRFVLGDSLPSGEVLTNLPMRYKLTIAGLGHAYPAEVPTVATRNWTAVPVQVENADTIWRGSFYSAKTITYELTFRKKGDYDLAEGIGFNVIDPAGRKLVRLSPNRRVRVMKGNVNPPVRRATSQRGVIAIDASESMRIEDVQPFRLAMVREGVANFLGQGPCDIGLLAFGGNVVPVHPSEADPCIPRKRVLGIDSKLVRAGTALGEVIWEACHPIGSSQKPGILVIITDGDNTAGRINVSDAIRAATENRLKVFTIGVGTRGMVSFGPDALGQRIMVTNTFSDVDLKRISEATGGSYSWVSTSTELKQVLDQIFSTHK